MSSKIPEIKPYPKNAKLHPAEQVELIAKSIKRFGWQQPIVVDKDHTIIVGHGRWLAAAALPASHLSSAENVPARLPRQGGRNVAQ